MALQQCTQKQISSKPTQSKQKYTGQSVPKQRSQKAMMKYMEYILPVITYMDVLYTSLKKKNEVRWRSSKNFGGLPGTGKKPLKYEISKSRPQALWKFLFFNQS